MTSSRAIAVILNTNFRRDRVMHVCVCVSFATCYIRGWKSPQNIKIIITDVETVPMAVTIYNSQLYQYNNNLIYR